MTSNPLQRPIRWSVDVTTPQALPELPVLARVSEELQHRPSYRYPGTDRPGRDHILFQYTLAGCGALAVDGRVMDVPPEHALFCRVKDPRIEYFLPEGQYWHLLYVCFSGPAAFALEAAWTAAHGFIGQLPLQSRIMDELRGWSRYEQNRYVGAADGARVLYALLAGMEQARDAGVDPRVRLVDSVLARMRASLAEPLSIAELAASEGVSREYLSRCFKEHLGSSPHQWYLRLRLTEAAKALVDAQDPIAAIATATGFESPAHFTRAFKKLFGMTPSACRGAGYRPVV